MLHSYQSVYERSLSTISLDQHQKATERDKDLSKFTDVKQVKEPMTATLRERLNRGSGLSQYSLVTGTKISLSKLNEAPA